VCNIGYAILKRYSFFSKNLHNKRAFHEERRQEIFRELFPFLSYYLQYTRGRFSVNADSVKVPIFPEFVDNFPDFLTIIISRFYVN